MVISFIKEFIINPNTLKIAGLTRADTPDVNCILHHLNNYFDLLQGILKINLRIALDNQWC